MFRLILRSSSTAGNFLRHGSTKSVVLEEALTIKPPSNEPVLEYKKGSKELEALQKQLAATLAILEDIPIVIGDQELKGQSETVQKIPHEHCKALCSFSYASEEQLRQAIDVAVAAQVKWDEVPFKDRAAIYMKAADLMAGKYRAELVATTMLGQSKTIYQAEIDAAAELCDFLRMHAFYAQEASRWKPISTNPKVTKNSMRYRGIDGFVAAVSPFNFTAIGGNLAYTPVLMGNAVLWKPSDTAVLSNWVIFKIMREAGVPAGVVNFVPACGPLFGDVVTSSPHLAGLNFTGSVPTFQHLWRQIGTNIEIYNNFPRVLGECGGKNFHFVHPTAEVCTVVAATIRSAFEYCGQKCSACSRAYIPESLWQQIGDDLVANAAAIKMGDVAEVANFMGAVIDAKSFDRIKSYIVDAESSDTATILGGGICDDTKGYFVEPTIIQVTDPLDKLMTEEIFGPVLSVYVYKDNEIEETIDLLLGSTKYALTGAVFAKDKAFLQHALQRFKMAAGNFYLNDKSTGAVVGQQPFGGARHSGTNDKAGGPGYVLRWTSPQTIKETFVAQNEIAYPYMLPH